MPRMLQGKFEVGGGDGRTYFAVLPPEPRLLNAFRMLEQAQFEARRIPGREGRARSLAISLVIDSTEKRIVQASIATSKFAEEQIVSLIRKTQVRPDPAGKSGIRLEDAIECHPLPTAIAGGGVGIADLQALSAVADEQGREYWRTQEFGSRHLVGRDIGGFFFPGFARPDPTQFRLHPVFRPGPGAMMHVRRPIQARAFLREGGEIADGFRQRRLGQAVLPALAELRLIQAGTHPELARARRLVARGLGRGRGA